MCSMLGVSIKLRSNGLSFHEFRPRFALFPAVGTGRIDVARGLSEGPWWTRGSLGFVSAKSWIRYTIPWKNSHVCGPDAR
ncbi:hypothetical protein AVEN_235509-1 [Araneus ventricosus]|uniref:Uncharacterized protein n=1 Tax=Araneus ventricosus TaxID=182803 RepID=A0A4Y2A476_ARAVE|nr:hypothetical protein AVEN_235509-1 [Araneus ventricosus]